MDSEISRSIFDKARDRYDGAMKIAFLSVVALLLFHITTFQPFINASTQLSRVEVEKESLSAVQPKLASIQTDLASLEKQTATVIDDALGQTMMLTVADFHQLNERVAGIRRGEPGEMPAPAEPPAPPQIRWQDEPMQMQMQMQGPVTTANLAPPGMRDSGPGFRALPAIDDATAERIRQTDTVAELRTLLLPYVRKNIVEFRFAELNEGLATKTPPLKRAAGKLRDKANQFSTSPASHSAYFKTLGDDMAQFVQALDALAIQPPDNDRWWTSVQSKLATGDALAADAESSLGKHLKTELTQQLQNDLRQTIANNEALKATLDKEIQTLETQFASQQAQFQKLVASMDFGVLNLKPVAAKFPILLAALLTALFVMLSRRIHELNIAIGALPAEQAELRQWLRRRVDMTGDTLFFDKVITKESLIALAALAWVAIASWQVAGWETVGISSAAMMYALSVPMIAFAVWYRKRVIEELAQDV